YLKVYGQALEEDRIIKSESIALNIELSNQLRSFAQEHNLTLNTVLQGAFALLLSRYTDKRDIIYGSTTSGRSGDLPNIESMVGLLINTLPVRVQLTDAELLLPWLKELQQQQVNNLQYEYTPLATIQDLSDLSSGTGLFDTIFVLENYPVDAKGISQNQTLKVSNIEVKEANNYTLTCLVKTSDQITLEAQYRTDRFEGRFVSKFLKSYQYILAQVIANPQQTLAEISILLYEEQELIESWQQTEVNYPLDNTIPELFFAQVNKTPDATALVFEEQHYTYQELHDRTSELANYLRELGVQPETPVGIYLERSEKMAIAILAIIKAGGAYVPLDPDYPQQRINFMIEDTELKFIFTVTKYLKNFETQNLQIINLDSPFPSCNTIPHAFPCPENAAYIIYTSGSTGKPKGVINTHDSLVNRLLWMQNAFQLTSNDKVLQKTPFSFDVSVWEFCWTWLNGACLVIAKPEGHKDSNYLVKLINQEAISVLHFVPSMLQVFLEESQVSSCNSLTKVICSGEALPTNIKNQFFRQLNAELHNLYGPTEAAIDVTAYQCHPEQNNNVPIGKAIANTQIYILNAQQQICPIGIPGELHIGGVGLSRGYLNRPDLTAEKFIPNPFSLNNSSPFPASSAYLLYKTGDLACYLPDGNIQYLGRIDNNVKIRGFRIDLAEIEIVLTEFSAIKQSVAIVRNDLGINPRIVAYCTGDRQLIKGISLNIIESKLRQHLQSKLPYYMVPDNFVFLEELPLNPNGKLDRKALPKPQIKAKTFISPRNDLEQNIAHIWQEILQLDRISIDDNFFELGGNSLSATRVNSRLKEALSVEIPLRTIFENPTIADIAQRIDLLKIVAKNQENQYKFNQENQQG
ncbi:MAG: amino acid adenylation domain-containing protein, partial [Cyanobacteria bacterium J06558_2]